MKKIVFLFMVAGLCANQIAFADGSVVDRAGNEIKKGGEAAVSGIEIGVSAVKPVLKKGGEAVVKGIKKGGEWVGHGLKETGEKIEKAADK